jgi:hypothetical protein
MSQEMKPEVQASLTTIEELIKAEFEKDPADHQNWEELLCWMVAYFRSEDWSETSTREMARIILAGWPEVNITNAREYLVDQMGGWDVEVSEFAEETREGVIERVTDFIKDNS